jgi:hypothetical protein
MEGFVEPVSRRMARRVVYKDEGLWQGANLLGTIFARTALASVQIDIGSFRLRVSRQNLTATSLSMVVSTLTLFFRSNSACNLSYILDDPIGNLEQTPRTQEGILNAYVTVRAVRVNTVLKYTVDLRPLS